MIMLGLDYSAGRPSGAAVRAAGYGFVARYLDNGLAGRANLTSAEAADMAANGVGVVLVWERKLIGRPDRATEGAAAGTADAHAAQAQAEVVGLGGAPIYFAVDFDVPDYAPGNPDPRAKLGPVGDYLAAARDYVGASRMGVYGGFYAVSRALDAGLVQWAWQTVAWSGGQQDKRIHLLQRIGTVHVDGVDCDVDEARADQFGQNPGGDDMATPQEIVDYTVGEKPDGTNINISTAIQDLAKVTAPDGALAVILAAVQALAADLATLKAAQQPAFTGNFSISGSGSVGTPGSGS
jgi:hypothetical protein